MCMEVLMKAHVYNVRDDCVLFFGLKIIHVAIAWFWIFFQMKSIVSVTLIFLSFSVRTGDAV